MNDRQDEVAALEPIGKAHPFYGAVIADLECPITGIRLADRFRAVNTEEIVWERKFPTAWSWRQVTKLTGIAEVGYVPHLWKWLPMKVPVDVMRKAYELWMRTQYGIGATHCCFCSGPVDYDNPGPLGLTTYPNANVICHEGCLMDHERDRHEDQMIREEEARLADLEPDWPRETANPNMGGI